MPNLDFDELRSFVETNTFLPEFQEVTRRARKHQRRRRLAAIAKIMGVLAVAMPGFVVTGILVDRVYHAPPIGLIGLGNNDGNGGTSDGLPAPAPKPALVTRTLVAADGLDLAHSYGLVDVCTATACNLQLAQVDPGTEQSQTQRVGLLRTNPSDTLTDPKIAVVNADTVIVSGVVGSGGRTYETLDMPAANGSISASPRPIQTTVQGAIRVVKGAYGQPATLAHQPPVSVPVLESQLGGWWVCGTAPDSGELAVSVSHDDGRTWQTHTLGLLPDPPAPLPSAAAITAAAQVGNDGPALATSDGTTVYVLVKSGGQIVLTRSTDGGVTWSPTATSMTWPSGSAYGMVTRRDGALLVWVTNDGVTSYLRSTDRGVTFAPDAGPPAPGGAIVQVRDGYITLGSAPAMSHNGVSWTAAYVPYVGTVD